MSKDYARQSRHMRTRCSCRTMTPWPDCCSERLLQQTTTPDTYGNVVQGTPGGEGVGTLLGTEGVGGSPNEQLDPQNPMYVKVSPTSEGKVKIPAGMSYTGRDPVTKRLLPGHTANPSGKARESRITRAMAERATPEAFGTLMAIMRSSKASLKLRKECAVEILDRGGVGRVVAQAPREEEEDGLTVEWDDKAIDALLEGAAPDSEEG